ncbi:MAG: hypothetical protein NDI93_00680 [Pseudomonas sp.]|nr:hypothetical protein [Pseudomonas sp.]
MSSEWVLLIRLFSLPLWVAFSGLIVGVLLSSAGQAATESATLAEVGKLFWQVGWLIALAGVVAALGISLWRWGLLYLWETGKLEGGCYGCGGPVSHKDGRYGPYSKCLICGSKREGWH